MSNQATDWLNTAATRSLQQVLRGMCGEAPAIVISETDAGIATTNFLWYGQRLALDSPSGVWAGCSKETWMAVGRRALEYAGLDEFQESDIKDTFIEIVNQWTSEVARAVAVKLKQPAGAGVGSEQKPPSNAARQTISVTFPDMPEHVLILATSIEAAAPAIAAAPSRGDDRAPAITPFVPASVPTKSKTLDLLLEVELPVSISFGRTELPLKDVLKLTSGSILELNRAITEPVDIIVNNCAIARGEVVVVDGNYGVRIQHIISRQERMRTLR
jgi:flagellar motor switch protein FliN/FliY